MGRAPAVDVALVATLALALLFDIKWRKIPNWLTYSSVILGLGLQWIFVGKAGIYGGLAGAITGFSLMFVMWRLGWMGAGDVKLLTAVGAMTYSTFVIYTGIYAILVSGAIALVSMVVTRRVGETFKNMRLVFSKESLGTTSWAIPYAVPIGIGVALAQFLPRWF